MPATSTASPALQRAKTIALQNSRKKLTPVDLPITKGLLEDIDAFRRIDEQLEIQQILERIARMPELELPGRHNQLNALAEIKADMESDRPMDRLLCGDVGFGKTELALRAAFKAAMSGKQTALLAPTTVLAQQHFHVFRERLAKFPVTVEMLSRFVDEETSGQSVTTGTAVRPETCRVRCEAASSGGAISPSAPSSVTMRATSTASAPH